MTDIERSVEDSLVHLKRLCSAKKDYEALDVIRKELKDRGKPQEVLTEPKEALAPHATSPLPTNDFMLTVHEKIKEKFGATPAWRIPQDEYLKLVEECKKQ